MDTLEELMSKRKWVQSCLRAKVAQPEGVVMCGTVKVAKIYSNILNNREKETELYDNIKNVAPEWWDDKLCYVVLQNLGGKCFPDSGVQQNGK